MPLKKTNTKREPAKTNNRFGKTKKGIRNKRRLNRTNSPGNANRKSAGPSEIAAGQNKKGESTRKASKRAGLFCDFHTSMLKWILHNILNLLVSSGNGY